MTNSSAMGNDDSPPTGKALRAAAKSGPRVRDELWKAFQVPVRAKLHGFHRELLAWECEAQEGFHLEPGSAIVETMAGSQELAITCLDNFEYPCVRVRTGLAAEITRMPCPCGRLGGRLLNLRAMAGELAARAACAADRVACDFAWPRGAAPRAAPGPRPGTFWPASPCSPSTWPKVTGCSIRSYR